MNKSPVASTKRKGTIAELRIGAKLLELGFEVYVPLVDDIGIDFVVRRRDGSCYEIQVKSVTDGGWFQVTVGERPEIAVRMRRLVVGVEGDGTCWVFPAKVFFNANVSRVSQNKKRRFVYDLNLDVTRRGNPSKNRELLRKYREAWNLLG